MTHAGTTPLTYQVFVAPPELTALKDQRPGGQFLAWSPISATLIMGERDAVLVDPLLTRTQAHALANWVDAGGKNLTAVYVTHGHGDHFFGIGQLQEAFPEARAVASPGTVAVAHIQGGPRYREEFWEKLFPGQIPEIAYPEPLGAEFFELAGHRLEVIEAGFTDTADTTSLWVPDLRLIVAGDVVYNDTHLYTAETTTETREHWARAAEQLAALRSAAVIAGHKKPDAVDDPAILEQTANYLRDFNKAVAETATAEELYDRMLALYPRRANPGALWGGSKTAKPAHS